jgi:hypothetical protein
MKNALIAAVVAAVVAAASATAATIVVTSANIKNGTIQAVDISAKAKRSLKGTRGPRGAPGLRGLQGSVGAAGSQGPAGQQGPQGAPGAQGGSGPPGPSLHPFIAVNGPTNWPGLPPQPVGPFTVAPGERKHGYSNCGYGLPTGGGVKLVLTEDQRATNPEASSGFHVIDSYPVRTENPVHPVNGWAVNVRNTNGPNPSGTNDLTFDVIAICVTRDFR